jgi:uncharacterized protein YlbG (UPF0298 family)
MKYLVDIEINNDKVEFAEEVLRSLNFVRKVSLISENEITNPEILQSIQDYESGKIKPTPMSLLELKNLIDA